MALDGGFLHSFLSELREAVDCHIDKIYQPSSDELVFLLRKKDFAKRLIISARSGAARLHFTAVKPENPAQPPMFCMLARKHFSSAKIISVEQRGLERVIELCFEATNEMGDRVNPKIICELIGNQSNIILLNDDNRIIDAIRRSDIESSKRLIQPGAKYEYPPSFDKLDPLEYDSDMFFCRLEDNKELPVSKAVMNIFSGISPLISREIALNVSVDDKPVCELDDFSGIVDQIKTLVSEMKSGGRPTLLINTDNIPVDFSFIDINQYGNLYSKRYYESYSELLDAFYSERETAARIKKAASDIIKLVNNLISRANKRFSVRIQELNSCKDREKLRIYGELIKANLYCIEAGSSSVTVQNFYDENLSDITIPLDPSLNPSVNASRYFKEYKKSHIAEQTLSELIKSDEQEIEYLESVKESISRCQNVSDIIEIREELVREGYIRSYSKGRPPKKEKTHDIKEYISSEGYKILVGKNNLQNDYITTRLCSKNDLWFHVKGIPGSHVVVVCDGNIVSDETIVFAARVAAKNSKAANSSNVPVDYTPIKYVKKPNGSKPGMVIYTTNKTVFVTPTEEL